MSNGEPGTSSNSSSGLSDKDQWLQDALGVKMANYASPTVDASAKVAPVAGVANTTERREAQGEQPGTARSSTRHSASANLADS